MNYLEIYLLIAMSFLYTIVAIIAVCCALEMMEIAIFFSKRCDENLPMMERMPENLVYQPFVSLHVPICCEPVDVVSKTLKALACLSYSYFEVIIVYNNTSDVSLWQPISDLCAELGPRFRFVYVETLVGFKAGALNIALRSTNKAAEIVGVIDSDYIVESDYLYNAVTFFQDQKVGFVQTPQNYMMTAKDAFFQAMYWEYWQFFEIGMVVRERVNALMLHGTMCLVRKSSLIEVGGWSEWCVTEDSELALRLLGHGVKGKYLRETYGRGLLPFTVRDYQRQRSRWALGTGQQIISYVFGTRRVLWKKLTQKQRFYIAMGWAPWLRDSAVVLSAPIIVLYVCNTINSIMMDKAVTILAFSLYTSVLMVLLRQCIIYKARLRARDTLSALGTIAILALTWNVGVSMIISIVKSPKFVITPKKMPKKKIDVKNANRTGLVFLLMLLAIAVGNARLSAQTLPIIMLYVIYEAALIYLIRMERRMIICAQSSADRSEYQVNDGMKI